MRWIMALVLLAACTSTDPTAPDLRKSGAAARTKVQFSWVCAGLTCTFTQLPPEKGPAIVSDSWYLIGSDGGAVPGSTPGDSVLEGNPMTFTFPAPDTYLVRLVAKASAQAYVVDSLVTVR